MTEVEQKLGALWSKLLDCGEVTEDADFFDCGGTSIAAVHLAALIQENFGLLVDAVEVVVERKLGRIAALIGEQLAAMNEPE